MIYTTKEAAEILDVSERYIQKKCRELGVPKKKNKYLITNEYLKCFQTNEQTTQTNEQTTQKNEQTNFANVQVDLQVQSLEIENERLKAENEDLIKRLDQFEVLDNERIEVFTNEQYNEFYKRLSEYPILKEYIETVLNELEYHKKSSESHQRQMEMILKITEQKNYIEVAKIISEENKKL